MDKKNISVSRLDILIVCLGALFYFYVYFLRADPSIIQSQLEAVLHIHMPSMFGLLLGAYFFVYTPMQLVAGMVVDKFNLRRIMMLSILCCIAGTILIIVSHIYALTFVGRILQGLGASVAFVIALKLAAVRLPIKYFSFFAGACTSLGFLGAAGSETVLSWLVHVSGWQMSLWYTVMFGLGLLVLVWFLVDRRRDNHIQKEAAADQGQKFVDVYKGLLKIVFNKYIWFAGILSFLLYLPTSVFAVSWGIPFLYHVKHLTYQQAATGCAMIGLGWAIGSPIQGWLSERLQKRASLIFIGALVAAGLLIFIMYTPLALPFFLLCILFVVFGISSSVQVLTFVMVRDVCHARIVGTGLSFVNMLSMFGALLFQPLVGDWLSLLGDKIGAPQALVIHGYKVALSVVPISLVMAVLVAALLLILLSLNKIKHNPII